MNSRCVKTRTVALDYNVVDMEAYPLAFVAMRENIPFLRLKCNSDGADRQAAQDWSVEVHNASRV
jgi:adenosylhomocysteine nucleosidase